MDLIKWQLNFGSCNFGLKSYLWFQIELALRARSILKSRVWFQTKLHSTQFNYHYISPQAISIGHFLCCYWIFYCFVYLFIARIFTNFVSIMFANTTNNEITENKILKDEFLWFFHSRSLPCPDSSNEISWLSWTTDGWMLTWSRFWIMLVWFLFSVLL